MPLFPPNVTIPAGLVYNVKDAAYGAKGDGITDDTAAIARAMFAAFLAGGGKVWFPGGVYISGNQTLYANVSLIGSGIGATTIRLKNYANTDLFSAQINLINLSAAANAGPLGNLSNFTICDMTIDGNLANQSGTSYPLRFYGYNFILRDLEILNGLSGGVLTDWNNTAQIAYPSDDMEALLDTVKIHDNNGIGLQMGGPHDSRLHNVISFNNASHNFHFAPNAPGMLCTNCHGYNSPNTLNVCCYLVEANGCLFTNCVAEGSYYCNVALIESQISWVSGNIFATVPNLTNVVGIQFGQQANQTPFPGQIYQSGGVTTAVLSQYNMINTMINECQGGALNEANTSDNMYICNVFQSGGTADASGGGYLGSTSTAILMVTGQTSDGSDGKGGTFRFPSASYNGFLMYDSIGNALFGINTFHGGGEGFTVLNGNPLSGYSDDGSTLKFDLDSATGDITTSGNISTGESASEQVIATNGTINTADIGEAKVAPTGNVTGVILQAGTAPGQECLVTNNSAFTVTFAAVGTSHVADGVLAIIPANRAMFLKWSSSSSKWFRV